MIACFGGFLEDYREQKVAENCENYGGPNNKHLRNLMR